jgi:hypothetical protein
VQPEVSVIMPVARPRPEWLRAAVESVLRERTIELELIVVDDGSEPPAAKLLDEFEDARLRIVRQPAAGVAEARTRGMTTARGGLVRFVDADDVVAHGSTARLAALSGGDWIAYGATVVCDEALRPRTVLGSALEGDGVAACLLARFDVRLPALVFPRAVVEAVGAWDATFQVCTDWDFVLRALEQAPVRGDAAPALYYRRHRSSLTGSATVEVAEEGWMRVVERYFERHPEQRGTALERRARAMLALEWARAYAHRGRYGEAAARLRRAAALAPARAGLEGARMALRAARRAAAAGAQRLR